jgi:hypothetical protein
MAIYVGNKKINEIKSISVVHDVLEEILMSEAEFLEDRPEFWTDEQKELYDLLNTLNQRVIEKAIEIIESRKQ